MNSNEKLRTNQGSKILGLARTVTHLQVALNLLKGDWLSPSEGGEERTGICRLNDFTPTCTVADIPPPRAACWPRLLRPFAAAEFLHS